MFKIGGISRQLRATENRFFRFPVAVVFVAVAFVGAVVVLAAVAVLFDAVALVAVDVIFRICKNINAILSWTRQD